MGIDTQRFVKSVPDKLLCQKCGDVLSKPKQCKLCSVMVCSDCLESTEEEPCNCGGQYISSNKFLVNKLNSLVLKCKNFPQGCNFTAKLNEIAKHEAGCHFQSSAPGLGSDAYAVFTKSNGSKMYKSVSDYNELPDATSPFSDKTYFITCRKGCNKQILTKKEYETHRCIDHLKNVIKDQQKEKQMLDEHISEAEKDLRDLLNEFERCKESQETVIDELKEKIMFLEKRNENLKNDRVRKMKDYEERLNEEKLKSEKESTLAFMNFIQTAEKDFTLFSQRLTKDFSKYKDKLKDEAQTYELKTKANFMAKEIDGIKKANVNKSLTTTPRASNKSRKSFK